MPRQTLHIRDFGGVVANMDSKDIPVNKAAYSKNVDPIHPRGRLKGIEQGSSQTYHTAVRRGVWIEKDASTKAFVYGTGSSTAYTESLASAATVPNSNTDVPTDIYVFGNAAYLARGQYATKWLGYSGNRFSARGVVTIDTTTGAIFVVKGEFSLSYSDYVIDIYMNATNNFKWRYSNDGGSNWSSYYDNGGGGYNTADYLLSNDSWFDFSSQTNGLEIAFISTGIQYETAQINCTNETEANYANAGLTNMASNSDVHGKFGVGTVSWGGSGSEFLSTDTLNYALSFVYDGYQESTYEIMGNVGGVGVSTTSPTSNGQSGTITITAYGGWDSPSDFQRRVTSVKIYRSKNGGLFRYVGEVDTTSIDSWTPDGSFNLTATITDDGTDSYSFESLNGLVSEIGGTLPIHTYGCVLNGYSFITGLNTTDIVDPFNKVVRSKAGQPALYDWTTDILDLNFAPKAIKAFNGRIYVFGENKYARINPDGLYVEDEFEGFGIDNNKAVIVTDYGMFWCNKNGAYMLNGSQPVKISIPIQGKIDSDYKQWSDIFTANTVISVAYSQEKESIIFCDTYGASTSKPCWVFYLPNQDWYYWGLTVSASGSVNSSLFIDEDGYVYLATGSGRYKLFASASYETWEWRTKELDFGDVLLYKKVYFIHYYGTATVQYLLNATDGTFNNLVSPYSLLAIHRKLFTLTIKVTGSTSDYLDAMQVEYRPLRRGYVA